LRRTHKGPKDLQYGNQKGILNPVVLERPRAGKSREERNSTENHLEEIGFELAPASASSRLGD